ncbi:MAG: hypothetical protein HZA08_07325 [Nitrospirae bacterium]|nr:hypothetical protein [Nitrospirota bacterium]
MANKSTAAKVRHKDGDELTLEQHETDSPIIPVAHLERLHNFRPDAVDWVLKQTEDEAQYRRSQSNRVNIFIFIQNLLGQIFAAGIGILAIVAGSYVAMNGQPWAGATIATAGLTGLAAVFLIGRTKK